LGRISLRPYGTQGPLFNATQDCAALVLGYFPFSLRENGRWLFHSPRGGEAGGRLFPVLLRCNQEAMIRFSTAGESHWKLSSPSSPDSPQAPRRSRIRQPRLGGDGALRRRPERALAVVGEPKPESFNRFPGFLEIGGLGPAGFWRWPTNFRLGLKSRQKRSYTKYGPKKSDIQCSSSQKKRITD
jgi:hypothetical protein